MKQQEMQELVKQHHPSLGEVEIRKMLNRAFADFAARTEILEAFVTGSTVVNQRYYDLPVDVLTIKRVLINDVEMLRLSSPPVVDDTTGES